MYSVKVGSNEQMRFNGSIVVQCHFAGVAHQVSCKLCNLSAVWTENMNDTVSNCDKKLYANLMVQLSVMMCSLIMAGCCLLCHFITQRVKSKPKLFS